MVDVVQPGRKPVLTFARPNAQSDIEPLSGTVASCSSIRLTEFPARRDSLRPDALPRGRGGDWADIIDMLMLEQVRCNVVLPAEALANATVDIVGAYHQRMRSHLRAGFRMRTATLEDIPAVVAVARACNLAEIGEFDVNEDWVHDEWVRPRFDPSTDAWVVTEPGGQLIAAAYTWNEEPHALFDSAGWVHPAYRGRGIGTAIALAVERRAMRDISKAPAGSAPRVLQSYDADASGAFDPDASGARALFEGLGYSPEREYLHMEIDVPDGFDPGGAPAGTAIRSRVEADDRAIVAVMEEGFREPWSYEEALQEWLISETYDPTLWLVAFEGDEAVGALMGYVREGRGQISALAVRNTWRRRGIAQALLRAEFAMFQARGVVNVRLNVDRDNTTGATHLYERAGMRLRRRWLMVAKTMSRVPDGPSLE